jgi:predicted NUDIX family NTP pyrophosphohydrolase
LGGGRFTTFNGVPAPFSRRARLVADQPVPFQCFLRIADPQQTYQQRPNPSPTAFMGDGSFPWGSQRALFEFHTGDGRGRAVLLLSPGPYWRTEPRDVPALPLSFFWVDEDATTHVVRESGSITALSFGQLVGVEFRFFGDYDSSGGAVDVRVWATANVTTGELYIRAHAPNDGSNTLTITAPTEPVTITRRAGQCPTALAFPPFTVAATGFDGSTFTCLFPRVALDLGELWSCRVGGGALGGVPGAEGVGLYL